jgi:hypothetical protein
MPDTQRTESAILTLFADNNSGNISPQDLRDYVVSARPRSGTVYSTGPGAATTISIASTFYATNWNNTGTSQNLDGFTATAGGRLTYTGTEQIHAHIACTISFSVAVAAAKELEFRIAEDGTTKAGSKVLVDTNGNTTKASTALHWDAMMDTNNYIELYVANNTDTTDVTIEAVYLFAMSMLR